MPAARSREEAFAPGADVRAARDLPVLIVAGDGPGSLAAVVAGVTEDLADSVIEADGPVCAPLADRSVALLNKGTPGCVVTTDGTLNISLMRSCSAWPCGVWIDGERRTAPDGSSFAWQHWSHTFEYALAAGPGDWRTAGFAAAGEDYDRDLVSVATGLHDGPLPAQASLGSVDPPDVVLTALKPRGNPLASGRAGAPEPARGVLVRLLETAGRRATARVRLQRRGGPAGPPHRPAGGGGGPAAARRGRCRNRWICRPRAWPAWPGTCRGPPSLPVTRPRPPNPPSPCIPATGCTARDPPRPGTCRLPCTSVPAGRP